MDFDKLVRKLLYRIYMDFCGICGPHRLLTDTLPIRGFLFLGENPAPETVALATHYKGFYVIQLGVWTLLLLHDLNPLPRIHVDSNLDACLGDEGQEFPCSLERFLIPPLLLHVVYMLLHSVNGNQQHLFVVTGSFETALEPSFDFTE